MDPTTAWKKFCLILFDRLDFYPITNLSIAFHAFTWCMLTSLSVDEMLLPRYMNWSTYFRDLPLRNYITTCKLFQILSLNNFIDMPFDKPSKVLPTFLSMQDLQNLAWNNPGGVFMQLNKPKHRSPTPVSPSQKGAL